MIVLLWEMTDESCSSKMRPDAYMRHRIREIASIYAGMQRRAVLLWLKGKQAASTSHPAYRVNIIKLLRGEPRSPRLDVSPLSRSTCFH